MEFKQKLSEEVFKSKYMINGESDSEEVFHEIAKVISSVELTSKKKSFWEDEFYEQISDGKLIPAGRILANARTNAKMPYYNNCYTIAVDDSIEGIYNSLSEDAQISRTGGGVGLNFSNLRPKDAPLARGGISSGAISFMKVFNESAKIIQTGGSRRSAHIGILNVDHPEIEDFITCKQGDTNNTLTQFNISVGVTDAFMHAVSFDKDWDLVFEGKVYKTVKAKYLYELMTKNAYTHNEPGILNIDTVNRYNNGYYDFKIQECNPCGEIVMPPYSLCCLSSINLTKFVEGAFTDSALFDFIAFEKTIETGIRFLDNVLDATKYPLQRIEDVSKQWRRVGLGFTGLGDMFAMLGVVYGSKESKEWSSRIGKDLRDSSYRASISLAREKGKFSKCDNKLIAESAFIKQLPTYLIKDIRKYGLRNVGLNTTAPTGSTALSVGQNCSSGIEPIFSLQYNRTIRIGTGDETKTETVYDYAWLKYLDYLKDNHLEFVDTPKAFATTFDIDIYNAIDIQSIFQKYIDHSISKTLNLPTGTTYEEYSKLFHYAYDKGLKGFTSFNPEGSMKGILTISKEIKLKRREDGSIIRPKKVPCDIHEIVVKGKNYLALVGILEEKPYEIFITANLHKKEYPMHSKKKGIIHKVKKGMYNLVIENGEEKIYIEDITNKFEPQYLTFGRLVSMILRSEKPVQLLVTQLLKDPNFVGFEKAVGRVLKKYIENGEKSKDSMICPECGGSKFTYQEGCLQCDLAQGGCGWSKCS